MVGQEERLAALRKDSMVGQEERLAALRALSRKKQLAFVLLIFERMLPELLAFSRDTGHDSSCYLKARDAAWAALRNGNAVITDPSLNEACLRSAPDCDEFSHELTSFALNAALTMSDILEFIVDGRADHIAYISTLATDSVDLYLSELKPSVISSTEVPELERKIAAHPLMQQELRRQEEDTKFLFGLPDHFDHETISALRTRASTQPPLLPMT